MTYILIQHEVVQTVAWLALFCEQSHGAQSIQVFRKEGNPKMAILILGWADVGQGRAWTKSADFQSLFQQCEPIGRPTVLFLQGQEQIKASAPATLSHILPTT